MGSLAALKINSYINIGLLFFLMGFFIMGLGLILGVDVIVMGVLFLFIIIIYILISPWMVKVSTGTRYLDDGEIPYLEKKVRSLADEAGIPMPKLGIVENETPNAFVYGITQRSSVLSVHSGILSLLNDSEMTAVLGHEIGHIKNRDCMYMTILSVLPLMASFGMKMLLYARFGRVGGRDSGKALLVILLIGVLSAIVYFLSSLLIKRLSRIREFYADAYSAQITRDPHSLSSALTKITYGLSLAPPELKSKSQARQFYIGNVQAAHQEMERIMSNKHKYDLDGDGVIDENELEKAMADEASGSSWDSFNGLFRTHPPTFKRILALKELEKEMTQSGQVKEEVNEKVEF
jgi:heat shock protein HtpX